MSVAYVRFRRGLQALMPAPPKYDVFCNIEQNTNAKENMKEMSKRKTIFALFVASLFTLILPDNYTTLASDSVLISEIGNNSESNNDDLNTVQNYENDNASESEEDEDDSAEGETEITEDETVEESKESEEKNVED